MDPTFFREVIKTPRQFVGMINNSVEKGQLELININLIDCLLPLGG
jgi:hypothetical protein